MKIRCATCDELHDLSDIHIGYERPDAWFAVRPDERETRWEMDSDLAALDGERFFIRGLVAIPVRGEAHPYEWGVWAAVGEADYRRYDAAYDDPERHRLPAFPGRLATQLPGYPQTLGVPVTVRLGEGTSRPSFTVDDAAHPLALEQRDGIYVERLLEMVSPALHGAGPEPRGAPRFATLEADRWRLLDVEAAWRDRTGPIWFPDEDARASVPVGGGAKLLWEIVASDTEGRAATHVERMWVEVDHRAGEGSATLYAGTLANDPYNPGLTRRGTRVWFTPAHVADLYEQDGGSLASEGADTRCRTHGASFPTYLCTHLFSETGQGFNVADDPGNPRPDAWCDRCEAVLLREGGWTEAAEAFADVGLACGTCYDRMEANNRRGGDGPAV